MPGTSLIVPEDIVLTGGRPSGGRRGARRQQLQRYLLVGLALGGWVGFLLLAAVLLLGRQGGSVATAHSGITKPPKVLVGPVIVADPWTPTALPVQVGPHAPLDAWIRISGVPTLASLSAGYTVGRGVWKVPVSALANLAIMAPARDTLRSGLRIALMSPEGLVMDEVQTALAVIPPALCGGVPSTRTGSLPDDHAPGPATTPPSLLKLPVLASDEDRRRAQELVLLGEMQRVQGRLGSARGYYEQAAALGSAWGAMSVAATFDPHEIAGTTLRPDTGAARAWYSRGRELMEASVAYYLKRLEQ